MNNISDGKKKLREEESPFSDEGRRDYLEVEEGDWEKERTSRRSRRSLLLVCVFSIVPGVLLLAVLLYMSPGLKTPQIVGERIRLPITSREREGGLTIPGSVGRDKMEGKPLGGLRAEGEPVLRNSPEPSMVISGEGPNERKPALSGELRPDKEGEDGIAKLERQKAETETEAKGEPTVARVEEPRPLATKAELPVGGYTVHTASFRKRARAERLMKELEEKGYEAFVEEANIPQKGIWYRVLVGRFPSQDEAMAFASSLKAKGFKYTFVRELRGRD